MLLHDHPDFKGLLFGVVSEYSHRFGYCEFRLFRISWLWEIASANQRYTMSTTAQSKMTLPVEREIQAAVRGQRELAAFLATGFETQRIQIFDARNEAHQVELPTSALRLLVDILAELADGNAVKVLPVHAELTTQEAADLLNVSRPHLVKLLEEGQLAFHRTGKHRRVKFADLMAYKEKRAVESEQAMALLAQRAQDLGMGYE